MTSETDKATRPGRGARQDRLKSALRENLKKRKLQARERGRVTEPSPGDEAFPEAGHPGEPVDRSRNE